MSMEFAPSSDRQRENHQEAQPNHAEAEQPSYFDTGPLETSLPLTEHSALDAKPQREVSTYQPRAIAQERAVLDKIPMHVVRMWPGEQAVAHDAAPEIRAHWRRNYIDPVQQTLRWLAPERQGLDLTRGDAFLDRLGFAVTSNALELPEVYLRHVKNIPNLSIPEGEHAGLYLPHSDTVLTFRIPRLEALNGPEISEINRIHELVHSSGSQEVYFEDSPTGTVIAETKSGYTERHFESERVYTYNNLIEEGVCDLIAGDYTIDVLNKPHGLADMPNDMQSVPIGFTREHIAIPSRYVILGKDGQPTCMVGSFAAAALEELITKDPNLRLPLMHGGHDPEAYQEVVDRMNAIDETLYSDLRFAFNDSSSFWRALRYVRGAVGSPNT